MSDFAMDPAPALGAPFFVRRRWAGRTAIAAMTADDPADPAGGDAGETTPGGRGRGRGRGHHGGPRGRRGGPGGPFGPFGPGPRGWWPGPGGPGPRARRGDVRVAVLALLAEEPRHGYQVIQDIAARTDGVWRPSAGAVYPALAQLEDEGLVRGEEADGRKVFHLTPSGRDYVAARQEEIDAVWDSVSGGVPTATADVMDIGRQLAMATSEVLRSGTEEQARQARDVLAEAKRAMYRILAEDPPAGP